MPLAVSKNDLNSDIYLAGIKKFTKKCLIQFSNIYLLLINFLFVKTEVEELKKLGMKNYSQEVLNSSCGLQMQKICIKKK